jgi:hypothetical protein
VKSLTVLRADALTQNEVPKKFNIIDLRLKCGILGRGSKNKSSGSNRQTKGKFAIIPEFCGVHLRICDG